MLFVPRSIRNTQIPCDHNHHYFYSKTNKMHQCIKFILFWNDTVHVSDDLQADSIICLTNACCCVYRLQSLMMHGKTFRIM